MKPGTIDGNKSMHQWESLVEAYQKLDIKVEVIDQRPDVPDMVFAADQGLVKGKNVLLSSFRYPERKGETKYYKEWFVNHGYNITEFPQGIFFEGNGDTHFWRDIIFVGTGIRTDIKACTALENFFGKEVIPIEIADPLFFHLDVALFDLDENTAFYYPPAFSQKSLIILRERVPNLIELTKDEVDSFATNSVITGNRVICQKGSSTFKEKLEKLGYQPHEVDVSEFMKSGGGVNCLTNILDYY
jgi:N-dimethylarginine dimethylaminohydrolase